MDITFYGLSTCIHCKHAREYLEECGIDFTPIYVDRLAGDERSEVIAEIKKHNPATSFPTMILNGTVVIGFNKDKINAALGISGPE